MNVLTKITTKRWLLPEFANNANRCWSKSSSSSNNNNSSSNRSNSSSKQDDLVKCEFVSGGRVAVVSLNDPPRMNALTEAMGDALEARVRELAQVRGLRAAVLTGEGRAFSAGGDLDFLLRESGRSRESNRETMQAFYRRFLSLRRSPVPWVAAVNGHAIGAGLCLAVGGCDVRVAHRDARMGMTFVRLGLHPGMAATHFLPQVVGPAAAAELMLTGRTITAEEALGMGLVSKVSDSPLSDALAVAEEICSAAPVAVRHCLETIRSAQEKPRSVEESMLLEATAQAEDYHTQDLIEGVTALREKRTPNFKGE